jgi:hypothetical protein
VTAQAGGPPPAEALAAAAQAGLGLTDDERVFVSYNDTFDHRLIYCPVPWRIERELWHRGLAYWAKRAAASREQVRLRAQAIALQVSDELARQRRIAELTR